MEKRSHAYCKTSDLLHAVKSVIDYSVRDSHLQLQSFKKPVEIYPDLQQHARCVQRFWTSRSVAHEMRCTGTEMTLLFQFTKTNQEQVLSVRSEQQASASVPWKCWCTGKVFSLCCSMLLWRICKIGDLTKAYTSIAIIHLWISCLCVISGIVLPCVAFGLTASS